MEDRTPCSVFYFLNPHCACENEHRKTESSSGIRSGIIPEFFHESMVVGLHLGNELQSAPEPLQQFNPPFNILHTFRWCLPDLRVLEWGAVLTSYYKAFSWSMETVALGSGVMDPKLNIDVVNLPMDELTIVLTCAIILYLFVSVTNKSQLLKEDQYWFLKM